MRQLETSLRRMRTDHVDVWLAHTWDEHTPIEETVSALLWAVESGRARYVGVSNHVGWQAARTMSLLAACGGAARGRLGGVQPRVAHARA